MAAKVFQQLPERGYLPHCDAQAGLVGLQAQQEEARFRRAQGRQISVRRFFPVTRGAQDTQSVSILGYDQLMGRLNLGLGSAVSVLIFLMVLAIAFLFVKGFGAAVPGSGPRGRAGTGSGATPGPRAAAGDRSRRGAP